MNFRNITETDYSNLPNFEKFVQDRGFEFDTENELKSAYNRYQKIQNGALLSEEEFLV